MFTGIITGIGKIVKYDSNRLGIRTPFHQIRLGESISIEGVCLTVTKKAGTVLYFDVGPETRRVTTLGLLKPGSRVNLERALRMGDRIGGHWVSGHVEETGRVEKIKRAVRSRWFFIQVPKDVLRFVVSKGSLSVDGVSLTVVSLKNDVVKIMVIPHTLKHTTLGKKQAGDVVNLEPDLLAKYAAKHKRHQSKIPYVIR